MPSIYCPIESRATNVCKVLSLTSVVVIHKQTKNCNVAYRIIHDEILMAEHGLQAMRQNKKMLYHLKGNLSESVFHL